MPIKGANYYDEELAAVKTRDAWKGKLKCWQDKTRWVGPYLERTEVGMILFGAGRLHGRWYARYGEPAYKVTCES